MTWQDRQNVVVVARRHALSGGEIGVLLAVFSAFVFLGTLLSPAVRNRFSVRPIVLLELYTGLGVLAYVARPSVYVLAAGLLPQAVVLPITDSVVIGAFLPVALITYFAIGASLTQ